MQSGTRPARWSRARGVLVLVALAVAACGGRGDHPAERELQGAVLIVLDTLRADRLSTYGNPRATSPELDALAARGVLFERAMSPAAWTLPGFVAILAGRYPSAVAIDGRLRESLVENLRAAGLRTAAVTEGGFVSRYYGMDLGFEEFSEQEGAVHLVAGGLALNPGGGGIEITFEAARRWLRENASVRFFLMVHTYEVHTPYRRREYAAALSRDDLPETFEIEDSVRAARGELELDEAGIEYVRALYDGGITVADRHVGELLDELEALRLADRTLVVVTSDHGEDLGEREPLRAGNHGHSLYDEMIRVPLIVLDPRSERRGVRVGTQVRTVDVMPTVLDLLGVAFEPAGDGRSLAPLLGGGDADELPAFAKVVRREGGTRMQMSSAWGFKLIQNAFPVQPPVELYDLGSDPGETHDVSGANPEMLGRLSKELQGTRMALEAEGEESYEPSEPMPEDLSERLRALGYVE